MTRIALLAALALSACSQPVEAKPLKPGLWKVADADTTIYLFGTIHLLPKDLAWTTPAIDGAIKASDALMLETVLDKDAAKTGAIMMELGVSSGLPPLVERVPPETRDALTATVEKAGVPMAVLDKLETWAAALTIASAAFKDLGVSPDYGAERVLTARFEGAKKPVAGFETPTQQLGFFDGLPEAAQRTFLKSVAEGTANAKIEFDKMIGAWGKGDTRAIAVTFDDELRMSPELTEVLLKRRNIAWAEWIGKRMDAPGTVFVAVGAGHLAGEASVDALLSAKGLKVSRVQ